MLLTILFLFTKENNLTILTAVSMVRLRVFWGFDPDKNVLIVR